MAQAVEESIRSSRAFISSPGGRSRNELRSVWALLTYASKRRVKRVGMSWESGNRTSRAQPCCLLQHNVKKNT